jgi:transposase
MDLLIPASERRQIKTGRLPRKPRISDFVPSRRQGKGIDWYRYVNEIVRPIIIPSVRQLKGERFQRIYVLQDGAPPHINKETLRIFKRHGVWLVNWPGNSPDLNPIEHIWDLIKSRIDEKYGYMIDDKALEAAWYEQWELLDVEVDINPLFDNMQAICQQVVGQGGDNRFHG